MATSRGSPKYAGSTHWRRGRSSTSLSRSVGAGIFLRGQEDADSSEGVIFWSGYELTFEPANDLANLIRPTRRTGVIGIDDPVMNLASSDPYVFERNEVLGVVRHQRSSLISSDGEDLLIGRARQVKLIDGPDILTSLAQGLGDEVREVLVEDQPHRAINAAFWWRSFSRRVNSAARAASTSTSEPKSA